MGESKKPEVVAKIIKASQPAPISKAEQPTTLTDDKDNSSIWIPHPIPMKNLKTMVDHSTILPQCIRVYKDNIAGFGISLRYREDASETPEMKAEWTRAEKIIDLLNLDMDTKEIFEDLIEARETYGISYLEVVRNLAGEVVEIQFIKDVHTIDKTAPLDPSVESFYFYHGEEVRRMRRFRKYRQTKNGKTVYFKEFGDPRIMDLRNGEYFQEGVDIQHQANELLEFAIGTEDYGKVRWIGQAINIDGARRAENLNNNYFLNGRHTPLAVIVSGGTLSDESFTRLKSYMDDIKGENGQHAFLLLEVEDTENKAGFEQEKKPAVELKDMASILQKDELFQDYLDNSRKKVQSAFRLPDLYTGYTTDFNRSTSQTAQEVTEKQVFQPERESLAWVINNRLLNGYGFRYVEAFFNEPDITNPDDIARMLNITERAGGLTPNMAKQVTYDTLGLDGCEDYEDEWGDKPLAVSSKGNSAPASPFSTLFGGAGTKESGKVPAADTAEQLDNAIQKAVAARDDDVLAVLKDVKKLLQKKLREGENV